MTREPIDTPCAPRGLSARPVELVPPPVTNGAERADGAQRAAAAQWMTEPERGSALLVDMMMFLALRLGRPVARAILYFIAAYFFVCAPRARRHGREYLRRALG